MISLVVAVAENGVIGADGGMPWRLRGDMRHFKAVTMGKPIVMGRKTFESLPGALPGRENIVISRQKGFSAKGAIVVTSADEAIGKAKTGGADEICVIGGAQIYQNFLGQAERIYLTRVHMSPQGDIWFPAIDMDEWREVSREFHQKSEDESADYSFIVLERA